MYLSYKYKAHHSVIVRLWYPYEWDTIILANLYFQLKFSSDLCCEMYYSVRLFVLRSQDHIKDLLPV